MRSSAQGFSGSALALLGALLVLPALALARLPVAGSWMLPTGAAGVMSVFAYFSYRSDKRRAERQAPRIPEFTLHLVEFLGGWPGAFVAQRQLRHKCVKLSYQVKFWAIVGLHQVVALDFLLGWRLAAAARGWIAGAIG